MKLEHWEPDVRTIVDRIDEGEIDLQPDFQRGQVWNRTKQQRLVDTILRGWSIPPVHLLVTPDERLLVLDGQQRLTAIHAFMRNEVPVQAFAPEDDLVRGLRGLYFSDLPEDIQRRLRNFKVSCYRLWDYTPDEPFELFFRLNLPTGLTQAEKRNALVGNTRGQVRSVVEEAGWTKDLVGFANSRMSYDDIAVRCCSYMEKASLRVSLSVSDLEDMYRQETGFSDKTMSTMTHAVRNLRHTLEAQLEPVRFNKATLLSWTLVHLREQIDPRFSGHHLDRHMAVIEQGRASARRTREPSMHLELESVAGLLEAYTDRASLRVNDVLSVITRDLALWALIAHLDRSATLMAVDAVGIASQPGAAYSQVVDVAERKWGELR